MHRISLILIITLLFILICVTGNNYGKIIKEKFTKCLTVCDSKNPQVEYDGTREIFVINRNVYVSAFCTIDNCYVKFNKKKREFTCTCCEQRYALCGAFLGGKATQPLTFDYYTP
jgi:hypothetical protein